jgi:hypothetical protein
LSLTQKKRKSAASSDEEKEAHKKHYHEGVLMSLKSLGDGLAHANTIQIIASVDAKIVNLREAIGKSDDRIEALTFRYFEATEKKQIRVLEKLLDKHHSRGKLLTKEYDEQMLKRAQMEDGAVGFSTP